MWFAAIFERFGRPTSRRDARRLASHAYQRLESRQLLAGIFYDAPTGAVTVAGDGTANVGAVGNLTGGRLEVTLNGFSPEEFDRADVSSVTFIGFGGDDQFTNASDVPSFMYGGDGNDVLIGGDAADQINGGLGNDDIQGNGGADRLIGSYGDDTIHGGDGDDTIFGSADLNTLYGGNGDDVIFGGNQVDVIYGDDGIDQIYALGGDDILFSGSGGVPGSTGISQADLILGLDGNDTFTGGDGLNVFYGGEGDDVMTGGNGQHRMHGQNGNDQLTGGSQVDYLAGNDGDDVLSGLGGVDFLLPGRGTDTVDGGSGNDFGQFAGQYRQYRVNGTSNLTVRDMREVSGNEGTDSLTGIEVLRFSDGDQVAESPIQEVVTVQPIVTADDNGSAAAAFFGVASTDVDIKALIDDIFYQANIDVAWANARTWNNTFANRGNGGTRPQSDLGTIVNSGDQAGKGNTDPYILDVYFVEIAAGFGQTSDNTANGLAYIGGNGASIHVGDSLLNSQSGRKVIARVVAHEIAHNLGLGHVTSNNNLMDDGTLLTASQIATILASPYSKPV